ncbi:MAG TPA: hypothetical protein VJ608_10250, partial [Albitalea sp.]|nr:hypothetical protein [Albitalea sp.]
MLKRLHSFARHRNVLERVVDVWLVDPAALQDPAHAQAGCLDDAERQRLASLRFERDRALYQAAHVFLRHVLSLYRPAVPPSQWHFDTAAHGRPEVGGWAGERGSAAPPRLRFSLSHTDGLVAVAVTHDWDIGVDVERERADLDLAVIAPALLAGPEHQWFGLLPT